MDDSIDQMNKTAKAILLFEVREFAPPMQQMGDIILQAAKLVREAVPLLSAMKQECAAAQHADRAYYPHRGAGRSSPRSRAQGAVSGKPQRRHDEVHRRRELYDHLEKVVDRFEDVSNEINAIVTDHL